MSPGCHLQAGSYTNFFADALIAEADRDARVIGIHAAMGGGTGMNRFEQRFPDRTFDVGIAEQVDPKPLKFHDGLHAACTMHLGQNLLSAAHLGDAVKFMIIGPAALSW